MSTAAQVAGEFYLEKTTFAPGEPVFLYFKVVNNGPDSVGICPSDPEQPPCSGTSITVSSDPTPTSSCPSRGAQVCISDGPPCSPSPLRHGQIHIDRFLLNFGHEINAPGEYWVEAKHTRIQHLVGDEPHAKLHFHVDGSAGAGALSNIQSWLDQLRSSDHEKRMDAARTLASLAPPSLETTLLDFANSPEFSRFAPLALHRLNNPRSMDAMAGLMKVSRPGTSEQMEAAHYLAESSDQKWYPLLLDAAEKNARISSYVAYAAELGGDKMLPVLVALVKSPDREFTHLNAVMALGSTGSRAAIPILLDQLKSSNQGTSDRARYSLQLLTHRIATQGQESSSPQSEYIEWSQWWKREGPTAPIYKDTQCGEYVPLR
jgi:hypothetical protein